MTAPLPTREWLAGFLGRFHAKALTNPSAWVEFVDELEALLRPAFERLEHLEACDKADPYETRRQLAIRIDALQAELAATKERARYEDEGLVLPLRDQIQELSKRLFTANASLARKDEALRGCVEALEVIVDRATKTKGAFHPEGPTVQRARAALARAQEAGK